TENSGGYLPRNTRVAAPMMEMKGEAPIEAGTTTIEVQLGVTWELR
ncbi:unnamed protein product, partial [marine sediment metagenome]